MIKQRVIAMLPRIFAIVAVVVILGAALGAGSALAAKGGNGKGKALGHGNGNGNGGSTTATVFAEPNPADAGSVVHIAGCGYDAAVEVHIEHATYTEAYGVVVWASGCFDFPLSTAEEGTYVLKAFQQGKRGLILMAEGTLEVQ